MAFEYWIKITPQETYGSVMICDPFSVFVKHLCGLVLSLHEIECKISGGVTGEAKYVVISSDTDDGVRPDVTTNFLKR